MRRDRFLRSAAGGAASLVLLPLLGACGGGGDAENLVAAAAADSPDQQALRATRKSGMQPGSTSTLTAEEIAALRYMREEEKLAHDVYVALYARWRANIFSTIAQSETQHTEAVLGRLDHYGIADPAAGRAPGQFEHADLQALYDALVTQGQGSLVAALSVAAFIEETDIRDLRQKIALTDEADVLGVYQNLLCGSYNHLRAFNQQLVARGVRYQAQTISQADWDAIASGAVTCKG